MFDLHHAEWFMSTVWRYKDVFTLEEESFLRREFNLSASTKLWGTDYRPFVVFVAFWRFFMGRAELVTESDISALLCGKPSIVNKNTYKSILKHTLLDIE